MTIRNTKKMYSLLRLAVDAGNKGLPAGEMSALVGHELVSRCCQANFVEEYDGRLYAIVEGRSLKHTNFRTKVIHGPLA
jgi:hypothetical protein